MEHEPVCLKDVAARLGRSRKCIGLIVRRRAIPVKEIGRVKLVDRAGFEAIRAAVADCKPVPARHAG